MLTTFGKWVSRNLNKKAFQWLHSGPVMRVNALEAKSRSYRWVGYQTNIPPTTLISNNLSAHKKLDIWWIESLIGEVLSHEKEIYSIYPPTKNMTFSGLSPSWKKYYPT